MINTTENAISRFFPSRRKCYQDHEFLFKNLKWSEGFRYSNKNCLYEAVIESILDDCGCLPSFAQGRRLSHINICQGRGLECAMKWVKLMGNDDDPDLTQAHNTQSQLMKCHQRCEYQYEVVSSSSSSWPSEMFYYRTDYCLAMQKLLLICSHPNKRRSFMDAYRDSISCEEIWTVQNTTGLCKTSDYPVYEIVTSPQCIKVSQFIFNYAKDNFAVLKIFINYPFYTSIKRDEEMSTLSFIANAGGLLGLCLGMSFVSITEVVYFLFHGVFEKISKSVC